MTFRFVGTECEISGVAKLTEFGGAVELPESLARELICPPGNPHKGAALLSDADFGAIGFAADELRVYAWPSTHADATPEFLARKHDALDALHELRLRLAAGGPMTAEGGE